MAEKTKALEAQLKTLNERIKKNMPGRSGVKEKRASIETGKNNLGNENKTVVPEENGNSGSREGLSIKNPGREDPNRIDPNNGVSGKEDAGVGEPDKGEVKKVDRISKDIVSITSKQDEILKIIKKRKISVYAMFVESEPSRIEDGTLFYILNEDKKWHKDQLNKVKNIELISAIVKEATGIKYKIKFVVGKIKTNNKKDKNGSKATYMEENDFYEDPVGDYISEEPPVDKNKPKEQKKKRPKDKEDRDSNKEVEAIKDMTGEKPEDVFKYFEKKFKIKE